MPESPEIDKQQLYGNFQRSKDWKDTLYKDVCHKALDIAEDMGVQANRIVNGMSWRELAVIGAVVLGGWKLWQGQSPVISPPPPPAAVAPAAPPTDAEYEIRFFDADGKPIRVDHISNLPKKE